MRRSPISGVIAVTHEADGTFIVRADGIPLTRWPSAAHAEHVASAMRAKQAIRKGDRVAFRPEWRKPHDDAYVWRAVEDADGGRVRVEVLGVLQNFNPQYVLDVAMLEKVAP